MSPVLINWILFSSEKKKINLIVTHKITLKKRHQIPLQKTN